MKKIVLLTFLFLTSIFLFAEEHTIVSFNINGKNKKQTFQSALSYLVEYNNADIVLLQELWIPKNSNIKEIMDLLTSEFKDGSWKWFTTFGEVNAACPTKQNNAVLYNEEKFDDVIYLNKYYKMDNPRTNSMCISTYNNVQAVKFVSGLEQFIVVNAHVSPHESYKIDCKSQHTKDFIYLKKFIEKIGRNTPLVLGGDMNFGTADLRGDICGEKFSSHWIVDGPVNEVPDEEPWVTSISGTNPWDHFIFNAKFKEKVKPVFVKKYNAEYGMRHALENSEKIGVKIETEKNKYKNFKYVSFNWYLANVSDHLPICITIETK